MKYKEASDMKGMTVKTYLETVAKYKMPPKGGCVNCGADIREMRRKQGIKYCPFCGGELEPCEP